MPCVSPVPLLHPPPKSPNPPICCLSFVFAFFPSPRFLDSRESKKKRVKKKKKKRKKHRKSSAAIAIDDYSYPMDYLASPVTSTASDESSYDDSTGPTTPASSPLFCPSRVDESLTRLLNSPPESCKLDTDSARDSLQSFPAWGAVKNVCVVGAGYVGMRRSVTTPLAAVKCPTQSAD